MRHQPKPGNDLTEAITALVKAAVVEALQEHALTASTAPRCYSSGPAGPYPPGKSRRWSRDWIRLIPGARKIGATWSVSVDDFDRWCAAQGPPTRRPRVVPIRPGAAWSAEGALAGAALRSTKAGRP